MVSLSNHEGSGRGLCLSRRLLLGSAFALAACATAPGSSNTRVIEADIWPGDAPGGEGVTAKEEIIERSKDPAVKDRAIIHVWRPRVRVFHAEKPDGSAVLILPGGGYQRVVMDKEGDETAMRLAASGVTCAVLLYRLPDDGWAADRDVSLADAQRAMRLLRSGRWASGVDAKRVGVLGFSAGGHLAASLALRWKTDVYRAVDGADAVSARPDFAGLIYPALGMNGPSPGRVQVIPDLASLVSNEAPPMFLLHAADDATVPVAGSLAMYAALKAAGNPAELHVYPEGGHGFGIAKAAGKPVEAWPDLFLRWGRARGMFR